MHIKYKWLDQYTGGDMRDETIFSNWLVEGLIEAGGVIDEFLIFFGC